MAWYACECRNGKVCRYVDYISSRGAYDVPSSLPGAATRSQVLRTRLRQPLVDGKVKYTGLLQTLRLVIAEEGAGSLYGGLSAHLMRVIPNAAVMFFNTSDKDPGLWNCGIKSGVANCTIFASPSGSRVPIATVTGEPVQLVDVKVRSSSSLCA